jgi:hypothetical protein
MYFRGLKELREFASEKVVLFDPRAKAHHSFVAY